MIGPFQLKPHALYILPLLLAACGSNDCVQVCVDCRGVYYESAPENYEVFVFGRFSQDVRSAGGATLTSTELFVGDASFLDTTGTFNAAGNALARGIYLQRDVNAAEPPERIELQFEGYQPESVPLGPDPGTPIKPCKACTARFLSPTGPYFLEGYYAEGARPGEPATIESLVVTFSDDTTPSVTLSNPDGHAFGADLTQPFELDEHNETVRPMSASIELEGPDGSESASVFVIEDY
ncbi:MAG: hypothetical protein RIT81_42050 [Deltaproteobacteria bacterium]